MLKSVIGTVATHSFTDTKSFWGLIALSKDVFRVKKCSLFFIYSLRFSTIVKLRAPIGHIGVRAQNF